jgi:hypothetical protein
VTADAHDPQTPADRARRELACRLIELAEYVANLAEVAIDDDGTDPIDVLRCTRRVRAMSVTAPAAGMRLAVAAGEPWSRIGEVYASDADAVREAHLSDYVDWLDGKVGAYPHLPAGVGITPNRWPSDPAELREAIDRWRARRRAATSLAQPGA